jgi:hypothetical protein
MAVLASVHEMTHTGGSLRAVGFQMILVTFHIFKKSTALRTFDGGPVRGTRGIGQTNGATMRAGGTIVFNISVSNITVIAIVGMFSDSRHGDYGVVMSIVE